MFYSLDASSIPDFALAFDLCCYVSNSVMFIRQQLRTQLDDAIAGECPFCGELMIREISLPFISSEEAQQVSSWEIRPHNLGGQRSFSLPA